MKQLYIVKSNTVLNSGATTPKDLSALKDGAIAFWELNNDTAFLSDKATSNFAIALGRPGTSGPIVFPEVDVNSMSAVLTAPDAGTAWSANITIPTPTKDGNYTLILVKKGAQFHERNTFTATTPVKNGESAFNIAKRLRDSFKAMANNGTVDITVVGASTAAITLNSIVKGPEFTLKAADDLFGTSINETSGTPAIGDKAYVEQLASMCSAGKGFEANDEGVNPGYPEVVEDTIYNIVTLRFAVGRAASHQKDERAWQIVHIAIPASATSVLNSVKYITGIENKPTGGS